MAKTVTTTVTANPNEYLVEVDIDGVINNYVTTPTKNSAQLKGWENRIQEATTNLDTTSHVNAQIDGTFEGENGAGNYEYRLDKKYGDMTEYFAATQEITLHTNEIDNTDPENPVVYPPLVTTCTSSQYSQDGVDPEGNAIYTVKLNTLADISDHAWYQVVRTLT